MLYSISNKERADKMTAKKNRESNQQISAAGDQGMKKQDVFSDAGMAVTNFSQPATPKIPQPKIDATDRRQIEAHDEDKCHTTKEELDDIKRIHDKEKKKKEQKNMEPYQAKNNTVAWVSIPIILKSRFPSFLFGSYNYTIFIFCIFFSLTIT